MADLQISGLPMYASFNSGELTPLLWDRVKFERYAPGAMLLDNFIVTKHGPIFHRPGSLFVNYAKRNNTLDFNKDKKRLKKFVFNRTQVFMLEFGHKYIKFYTYDSAGDPITVQKDGADYIIETPYRAEDLPELRFTQSMDTIYIAHSLYHPRVLMRHAASDWEFGNFNKQDGPYEVENTDKNKKLKVGAKTGTGVALTATFNCFNKNMVGRVVRLTLSKKPGWGVITAVTDAKNAKIDIKKEIADTSETISWRLGAWYGTEGAESTAHYPAAVAFHMERLYFGGGLYTPQTVQGSRPGDFPVFSPTDDEDLVTDDMAVMFSLATDELNSIVWLKSTDSLYIGTIGPEFKLTVTGSEVITPSNFQFQRISNYGSSRVEPQFIGNSIIFSQNSLRTLRELTYNFSTDKYVAQDISVLGEHLTAPGLNSFNFQQEPHSIIWATQQVRENQLADTIERAGGRLIGLTYDKEQNVMAWHRHTIGGTEVEIESVECVFNDTIQQDQVWFCCRRKLNGQYVRTIEVIDKDFRMESPLEEMYFVDCGIKYNAYKLPKDNADYGLGVKHLKGLTWLAGEKVKITVDGAMHPDKIVNADGTLNLDYEGKFITVGLYAPAKYQSLYLDPEAGGTNFAQGHMQNIPKALIRFYRTMGGKFGPTFDKLEPIEYRTPQDAMDTAVPLFTGEKTVHFP
ncbi:MAG: hypothetical protein IKU15_07045, partial [Clostridia bacterium]|nr:hypothetical protein [Clostridia bacterium]